MTIPASTVPTAKLYLFNGITTAVNDTSVLVSYDEPGTYQPDDLIVVGDVEREVGAVQMVGSGQAGWLSESYTIEIVVSVYRGGDDARSVFERAAALEDIVVSVVRADPSLGGAVLVAVPSTSSRKEAAWDSNHLGRQVTATIQVSCEAFI